MTDNLKCDCIKKIEERLEKEKSFLEGIQRGPSVTGEEALFMTVGKKPLRGRNKVGEKGLIRVYFCPRCGQQLVSDEILCKTS